MSTNPMTPTDPNERARELKPCPFCGGEATISWKGNIHSTRSVVVKCSGCRYERKDSALRYGDDWLLDVAVTAWNRRALSPAPAAVAGGDAEEDAYVIDALAHLLAEISVIVNGPEPAGTKWSYHDLPEKVAELKRRSS